MIRETVSGISAQDLYLFNEGNHFRLFDRLGAHPVEEGVRFAVWAPNAASVAVIGEFNDWNPARHVLDAVQDSGIWEAIVTEARPGQVYKYHVVSKYGRHRADKADPLAQRTELPPRTGSIVHEPEYEWRDSEWMQRRAARSGLEAPVSIYEVHLGSWRRVPEEDERSLTYRELATQLPGYVRDMGFTHVELLPITEHPFGGSWGYQTASYFAPTSRFGGPEDLMYLIDALHREGIGVILDWVPSHFPADAHSIGYFDGTHLYEHADPRQGVHPDWGSVIFNYGRREVRSFLISSACYWLDRYHVDGLRVDAVASMLYLDYSRKHGEWIPNRYGGKENLEAIEFLRQMNEVVYRDFPGVQTFAEESTSWPMVSRPLYLGGLGFGYKWDMGWMHDTLAYMSQDPVHRRHHHSRLTFRALYAFHENFVNALSHDEVVHGKGSLLSKMPGDSWQKCANLRLLFGYQYAQPGKKLLFMGGELGQWREWNHEDSLDWHLQDELPHAGIQRWVADLNRLYRECSALHAWDCRPDGFEWVDCNDVEQSVLSFLRRGPDGEAVLCVFNFTPVARPNYRVGVPFGGRWVEKLNSDAHDYGGGGGGNFGGVEATPTAKHGRPWSITVLLPPLACVYLQGSP